MHIIPSSFTPFFFTFHTNQLSSKILLLSQRTFKTLLTKSISFFSSRELRGSIEEKYIFFVWWLRWNTHSNKPASQPASEWTSKAFRMEKKREKLLYKRNANDAYVHTQQTNQRTEKKNQKATIFFLQCVRCQQHNSKERYIQACLITQTHTL